MIFFSRSSAFAHIVAPWRLFDIQLQLSRLCASRWLIPVATPDPRPPCRHTAQSHQYLLRHCMHPVSSESTSVSLCFYLRNRRERNRSTTGGVRSTADQRKAECTSHMLSYACVEKRVANRASTADLQFSQRSTFPSSSLPIRQTRTFLTHLRRQAQALKEQPISSSTPIPPKQAKQPRPTLSLTNLPYFVRRTGSNQLPVYLVTKAGGTKQLTKIQKTEGDLDALRDDLAYTLGVDLRSPDVSINRLNGHIIVKVWLMRYY